MTAKGQMVPTFRVSSTASKAEHTIVSSIRTDLIFRRNRGKGAAWMNPSLNQRSDQNCGSNVLPNSKSIQEHYNSQQILIFEFFGLKTNNFMDPQSALIQISVKNAWINCIHFECWKHNDKNQMLTNGSNDDPSITIQVRNLDHERTQNFRREQHEHSLTNQRERHNGGVR